MICPKCKLQLGDGLNFCPKCGSSLMEEPSECQAMEIPEDEPCLVAMSDEFVEVTLTSDKNCRVYENDKCLAEVRIGVPLIMMLPVGQHNLLFRKKDNEEIKLEKHLELSSIERSYRVNVSFKSPAPVPVEPSDPVVDNQKKTKQEKIINTKTPKPKKTGNNKKNSNGCYLFFMFFLLAFIGSWIIHTISVGSDNNSEATTQDSLSVDLLHIDEPIDLKTKRLAYKYSHNNIEVEIEVDYPIEGPELTLAYLRKWIDRFLGGEYSGSLSDGQSLVDFYGEDDKKWMEEMFSSENDDEEAEDLIGYESPSLCTSLKLSYQSDKYVNYKVFNYICLGGAHGESAEYCETISLLDGKEIDSLIFSDRVAIQSLLKKGLKESLGCNTDDELKEKVLNADISELPLPSSIWMTPEGLVFHYFNCEIVSPSYGEPEFTIPYSKIILYIKPEYQDLCK